MSKIMRIITFLFILLSCPRHYNNQIENIEMASEPSIEEHMHHQIKRSYHKVTEQEKKKLAFQLLENQRSINKAAKIIGINISTAKVLARKIRKRGRVQSKPRNKSVKPLQDVIIPSPQLLQNHFAQDQHENMAYFSVPNYQLNTLFPMLYFGMVYY